MVLYTVQYVLGTLTPWHTTALSCARLSLCPVDRQVLYSCYTQLRVRPQPVVLPQLSARDSSSSSQWSGSVPVSGMVQPTQFLMLDHPSRFGSKSGPRKKVQIRILDPAKLSESATLLSSFFLSWKVVHISFKFENADPDQNKPDPQHSYLGQWQSIWSSRVQVIWWIRGWVSVVEAGIKWPPPLSTPWWLSLCWPETSLSLSLSLSVYCFVTVAFYYISQEL